MQELEAAALIPSGPTRTWGKQVNAPNMLKSIIEAVDKQEPFVYVQDEPIYKVNRVSNIDEYVAFAKIKHKPQIVFYSQVKPNKTRNNLFKPRVGRYQSMIWKQTRWVNHPRFATDFILEVLLKDSEMSPMILTDMKQTEYGLTMWIYTLIKAMSKGYNCYYGLSTPSDAKCIIKLEDPYDVDLHYDEHIVNEGSQYAYRCALITKSNVDVKSLLLDPDHTLILTNTEAEELGAYDNPEVLTLDEESKMLSEYYSH